MNWFILGGVVLMANAIAHVVSAVQVRQRGGPQREFGGISAYVIVYAALGVLMLAELSWAPWATIVLSALGMAGLLSTWSEATAPLNTNRTILGLDIAGTVLALIAGLS